MIECSHSQVRQLVSISEDRLYVDPSSIDQIKKSEYPIAFVSICGDYRTGKSSLLNLLFEGKTSFQISPTTESCTKGIQIIQKPIHHNGINVWILDTEGFGTLDKPSQMDGKLFLLSLFLSSVLLYNSLGVIDEEALKKLAFVCQQAKRIDENLSQSVLIWILRDFCLELSENNEKFTPDQYLQACLEKNDRYGSREEIKRKFKKRFCCPLVRPTIKEEELGNLNKLDKQEIRKEFLNQIFELKERIFLNVSAKSYNKVEMCPTKFCQLFLSFVQKINTTQLQLSLQPLWEQIIKHQEEQIVQQIFSQASQIALNAINQMPLKISQFEAMEEEYESVIEAKLRNLTSQERLKRVIYEMKNKMINNISKENKKRLQIKIQQYLKEVFFELQRKIMAVKHIAKFEDSFKNQLKMVRAHYEHKFNSYYQFETNKLFNKIQQKQVERIILLFTNKQKNQLEKVIDKMQRCQEKLQQVEEQMMKVSEEKEEAWTLWKETEGKLERMKNSNDYLEQQLQQKIKSNTCAKQINEQNELLLINLQKEIQRLQDQKRSVEENWKIEKEGKQKVEKDYLQQVEKREKVEEKFRHSIERYFQLQSIIHEERIFYNELSKQKQLLQAQLQQKIIQKEREIAKQQEEFSHAQKTWKQSLYIYSQKSDDELRKAYEENKQIRLELEEVQTDFKLQRQRKELMKNQLERQRTERDIIKQTLESEILKLTSSNVNLMELIKENEQEKRIYMEKMNQEKCMLSEIKWEKERLEREKAEMKTKFGQEISRLNQKFDNVKKSQEESLIKKYQIQIKKFRIAENELMLELEEEKEKNLSIQVYVQKLQKNYEIIEREKNQYLKQIDQKNQAIEQLKECQQCLVKESEKTVKQKQFIDVLNEKNFIIHKLQEDLATDKRAYSNLTKIKRKIRDVLFQIKEMRREKELVKKLLVKKKEIIQELCFFYERKIMNSLNPYIQMKAKYEKMALQVEEVNKTLNHLSHLSQKENNENEKMLEEKVLSLVKVNKDLQQQLKKEKEKNIILERKGLNLHQYMKHMKEKEGRHEDNEQGKNKIERIKEHERNLAEEIDLLKRDNHRYFHDMKILQFRQNNEKEKLREENEKIRERVRKEKEDLEMQVQYYEKERKKLQKQKSEEVQKNQRLLLELQKQKTKNIQLSIHQKNCDKISQIFK